MTIKKIGIPISKLGENSVGLTLSYLQFASQFGEAILLLPDAPIRADLDMILLQGGADVDAQRYGQFPSYLTGKPDIYKEYFDTEVLPEYIANGVPVFGICRGIQTLAVHFGGKLYQHMVHETNKAEDPYKIVHKIKLDTGNFSNWARFVLPEDIQRRTPVNNVRVVPKLDVNSRHHQSVKETSLPDDLVVIARHEKDNHVEMIAHRTLPVVGVQFHCEDLFEPEISLFMDNIMRHLLDTKTSILA